MTELVLYGHPDSGHANKVALALALAGVPHELRRVDIWAPAATRPAEFLAASPLAQVPLLMVDGVPHLQSGAILMEVARRWPLPGQQPHDLRRGAELILWEANRIGMCLPQLVESRRPGGDSFPPGALDWLRARYATDRDNFDRLLGAGPLRGSFPPDRFGLTLEERKALQARLNAGGFEAGTPDGVLGSRTTAAIEAYQAQAGLAVTGEPSPALLARLGG